MPSQSFQVKFSTDGVAQVVREADRAKKSYADFLNEALKSAEAANQAAIAAAGNTQKLAEAQKQAERAAAQANRAIAASYRELNVRASADIEQQKVQAIQAFEAIKTSGVASASDIARAQQALKQRLAQLDGQLNQTENAARLTAGGFTILKGAIANIASSAVFGAINSLTNAVQGVSGQIVEVGAQAERQAVAFETFLGSAEKAQELLKNLREFAATTPFELPEVTEAAKQLASKGVEVENIIPTIKKLGEIAAGADKPLNQILFIYGQIKDQNRATGQDLAQLTNAGLSISDIAKALNITTDEVHNFVSEGKFGFAELEKVISSVTSEGGRFAGLMDKLGGTTAVKLSNLNDAFTKVYLSIYDGISPALSAVLDLIVATLDPLGESEGLFADIKAEAQQFSDFLKTNPQIAQALAESLKVLVAEGLAVATQFLKEFTSYLEQNPRALADGIREIAAQGKLFLEVFGQAISVIADLLKLLSPLVKVLADNKNAVGGLLNAFSGFDAISKVVDGFSALESSISKTSTAIAKISGLALSAVDAGGWISLMTKGVNGLADAWKNVPGLPSLPSLPPLPGKNTALSDAAFQNFNLPKGALNPPIGSGGKALPAPPKTSGGQLGKDPKFNEVLQAARSAGANEPEALLMAAQWALESGWGKSQSGKNNFFGIKARPGEPGTMTKTWEDYGSGPVIEYARFRDYATPEEGVKDRLKLTNQSRYRGVKSAQTAAEAIEAIKLGGYATDPSYVPKLISILRGQGFDPYARQGKSGKGSYEADINKVLEEARKRQSTAQQQKLRLEAQALADQQKLAEAQLQRQIAAAPETGKLPLEQQLAQLQRKNQYDREALQIKQAIAQLERERTQKIQDQKAGKDGDPRNFTLEIQFLQQRLKLLGETSGVEGQISDLQFKQKAQVEQRRIMEEARQRASAQQQQQDRLKAESLADQQKLAEAQMQLEISAETDPARKQALELRLATLQRENELARQRLEIEQAIAQLERERAQKIQDQQAGLPTDAKDYSAEIAVLQNRLSLLNQTSNIEQQIQANAAQQTADQKARQREEQQRQQADRLKAQALADQQKLAETRLQLEIAYESDPARKQALEQRLATLQRENELARQRLEIEQAIAQLERERAQSGGDLAQLQSYDAEIFALKERLRLLNETNKIQGEIQLSEVANQRLESIRATSQQIAEVIGGGFADLFNGIISGTQGFGSTVLGVLRNILNQIGQMFIQTAANIVSKQIFKSLFRLLSGFLPGGGGAMSGGFSAAGIFAAATGGLVVGPGTETSDSVPALLSNNEYVLQASAVKAIGVESLNRMNEAKTAYDAALAMLPRFAAGGLVSLAPTVPRSTNAPISMFSLEQEPAIANNVNITVVTPNADSFRRSEDQLGRQAAEQLVRGQRRF